MLVSDVTTETRARFRSFGGRLSVRDAAEAFSDRGIGLLVIRGDNGEAAGVVSKSDLVRHLARSGRFDAPLMEVMSRPVVFTSSGADLRQTWQFMVHRRLQNLPLLDDGRKPVGMLNIRDALEAILRNEERREDELINYITGIGYR